MCSGRPGSDERARLRHSEKEVQRRIERTAGLTEWLERAFSFQVLPEPFHQLFSQHARFRFLLHVLTDLGETFLRLLVALQSFDLF